MKRLPIYRQSPVEMYFPVTEAPYCPWCRWYGPQFFQDDNYYRTCLQPQHNPRGAKVKSFSTGHFNNTGDCAHYEPTRRTRLLRLFKLGRAPVWK